MRWLKERALPVLATFFGWVFLFKAAGWPSIFSWEALGIIAGMVFIVAGCLANFAILQERSAMTAKEGGGPQGVRRKRY